MEGFGKDLATQSILFTLVEGVLALWQERIYKGSPTSAQKVCFLIHDNFFLPPGWGKKIFLIKLEYLPHLAFDGTEGHQIFHA